MSLSMYSYLITVCFFCYIQKTHSHYVNYYTNNRMRFMLYAMDRELIKDSWAKIRSIQYMKAFYYKSPSFLIAERIFYLRRKFARMMRLYNQAYEELKKLYKYEWRIEGFIKYVVNIQQLAMDIDHLVEMLTDWEAGPAKNVLNIGGFVVPSEMFNTFGKGKFSVMEQILQQGGGLTGPGGIPGPDGIPGDSNITPPGPGGAPGPASSPSSGGVPGPEEAPGPKSAPRSLHPERLGDRYRW